MDGTPTSRPLDPSCALRVELDCRSYDLHIGDGNLARAGALITESTGAKRCLVVADATVARLHGATLAASLDAAGLAHAMATFPAGEPSKSLATAERLWSACAEQRLDRGGLIVALGGGVAGDLAGFTAACWMRGVRFVQIPTTLLAMVDSSVGGKTGVNSAAGKNLVGAFHQPSLVIADTAVLTTMDDREYRAGLAEVLKYGVIREPDFLAWQEANAEALAKRDGTAIAHAVRESCRIKAAYVVEDETEQGVRAHLNYGHTFGHALEGRTAYTRYLHGEAVGIGMRMAADLAQRLGLLETPDLLARQDALLRRYGLPLRHEGEADRPAALADLVRRCGLDKKVAAGRTRFIVPRRPGAIELISAPDEALVAAAFASAMA